MKSSKYIEFRCQETKISVFFRHFVFNVLCVVFFFFFFFYWKEQLSLTFSLAGLQWKMKMSLSQCPWPAVTLTLPALIPKRLSAHPEGPATYRDAGSSSPASRRISENPAHQPSLPVPTFGNSSWGEGPLCLAGTEQREAKQLSRSLSASET